MQKAVGWLVPFLLQVRWLNRIQRTFFHGEMGFHVHVGGVQAFVAKPKSNHCDFDSGLKVHRRGVATMSPET